MYPSPSKSYLFGRGKHCRVILLALHLHVEGPLEFLFYLSSRRDAECTQELPEIDRAVAVSIKRPEDVFRELAGITVREEVAIDLLELFHGQRARGTVFQETSVPSQGTDR